MDVSHCQTILGANKKDYFISSLPLTWKTAAAPKPHMKKSHENLTWKSHMKNSHENLTWKTHLKNSHEKLHFPKTLLAESRMGLASSICPDSISAVLSRDKKRKFWPFYWAIKSGITFLYLVQPTCKHSKREASSRKYKQIQIQIMPNTNTNTNSVKYKYKNLKTLCNQIVNTARERPHLCSFWGSANILLVFYLYLTSILLVRVLVNTVRETQQERSLISVLSEDL